MYRSSDVDVTGHGSYYCFSSDQGTALIFSGGRLVETGPMHLIDSVVYCASGGVEDSLAIYAGYHSQWQGPVDSIVMLRMMPDSLVQYWPPFYNDTNGEYTVADIGASYYLNLYETRPPTATTCLTNDPLLDQQLVRDFFRSIWDSSSVTLPTNQRVEHGGWIYQDSATGALIAIPTPYYAQTDGPCSSYYEPPEVSGNIPVAHAHTHPFLRGESVTCPPKNGEPAKSGTWNPLKSGAPSPADIANISSNHIQEIIIDSTDIYIVPSNVTARNSRGVTKNTHRHQSNPTCALF